MPRAKLVPKAARRSTHSEPLATCHFIGSYRSSPTICDWRADVDPVRGIFGIVLFLETYANQNRSALM